MTQLITLLLDSKKIPVLCHMGDFGCGDGGWTPVMKMNGSKVNFSVVCSGTTVQKKKVIKYHGLDSLRGYSQ